MKELKVAKYQIFNTINSIMIFYAIFITVIVFLGVLTRTIEGSSSSGLEVSTIIFLLVAGLNSFKSNFKLMQANNVSRKVFVKGLLIGVFPITLAMSLIDLIINRVYNIFINCPTIFDMIYGNFRGLREGWMQSNNIQTLFGTVIWQFAVYSAVFIFGILVSLCYYRSNKKLKVLISIVPAMLVVFSANINQILLAALNINIGEIFASALGLQSQNPYLAVFSFAVLGILFSIAIYLLTRKAIIKE
ncbi:hypothetical protein [Acetivibrio cellulolyticus]|uniref:hypothetical protein n=1 Tax=Acetivibrio cellulolyticus TaxID=35830 RepID=UPI0001E2FB78|nr:hypothetical protein [Acetivibrio cellulolyticus]